MPRSLMTDRSFYDDFVNTIRSIQNLIDDDISFLSADIRVSSDYVNGEVLKARISQAIVYLTELLAEELGLAQTELILNSLRDNQLRARCGDLLLAEENFDRAVSEATRVLEDRIRNKSRLPGLTGVQLVNQAIKQEKEKSPLILSDDAGEQRGFSDILRGVMAAHRNKAHHFIYSMSREDAANICAYIDVLLEVIDNAKVNVPSN